MAMNQNDPMITKDLEDDTVEIVQPQMIRKVEKVQEFKTIDDNYRDNSRIRSKGSVPQNNPNF